jgi:hypothetical protein
LKGIEPGGIIHEADPTRAVRQAAALVRSFRDARGV